MAISKMINIVGVHAEGEVGDVIVGGVLDVPGKTMFDKMMHFWTKGDELHAGFIIMESEEYAPMSGSNTICTTTALLETGMIKMEEPVTTFNLDTAAGLVTVTADCKDGKCKAVAFDNVPSFVFGLDYEVDVPGLGKIPVDIAWGGMLYALVDVSYTGLEIKPENAAKLVECGERIKKAVQAKYDPIHPENPGIHGVSIIVLTGPLEDDIDGGKKAINTVVVSPGRLDRSPCGTGTCARMAQLHARGLLAEGQTFRHISVTGTEFLCKIRGTTKVGDLPAVLPTVKGRAWITGFQQVSLDAEDPFPVGYRVGDMWHTPS
ncbi:hypothetical protein G7Z17_g6792 [Cylindrodendrum hubeiense]|uniref:Proline racemase n=1 Tax=Cylindrodendrum hubeiense TaxID=595255 RepID=A0A9P5HEH6_9HYPO|nr:hypothetical protein G7Z17_g6792 [Cylindrodendrum hubeiense]